MNILIVEDDLGLANLLRINMELYGFVAKLVNSCTEFNKVKLIDYDLVILDINLPDGSGYDLIKVIKDKKIPIIILSAFDQLENKIKGFELGADDYLTKPFESIELIMRIKSILRRSKTEVDIITFGSTKIDFHQRLVTRENQIIELTNKEFDLLKYFILNKNYALSRAQILSDVWGFEYVGNTRTVDIHVQRIRAKLDFNLKTIYGYGYRLELK